MRDTCPVYKVIKRICLFEQMNSPDIALELRDKIYYKDRKLKNVDLEKILSKGIDELWSAVTEVKIENMGRHTVHARAIVERL